MALTEPTPAIIAVSMLLSARKEIRARGDGSQNILGRAMWAVVNELKGEELAAASLLVNIDNERTREHLNTLFASHW